MALTLLPEATPGHEAGDAADAVAAGTVTSGVVAVVTGAEPQQGNGVLVEVSFTVDDAGAVPGGDIAAGHTFTVTQNTTATGVGAALTGLATQSTQQGFTLTATAAALPHTMYLFSWTG